jgi:hypothetical protein
LITCLFQFKRKSFHPDLFLVGCAFCCTQSSFDRPALNGTQYLGNNALFGSGAGEGDAGLPTVNDPFSAAGVPNDIAFPLVVGVQHAPTAVASQKSRQ